MPLIAGDNSICFGDEPYRVCIRYSEFPDYLGRHRAKCPDTANLQMQGAELREGLLARSSSLADAQKFIIGVCEWGGDKGPVINQIREGGTWNEVDDILTRTSQVINEFDIGAAQEVQSSVLSRALLEVEGTFGLGVSYGSKVLRMLEPEMFGVLDKQICFRANFEPCSHDFATYCLQLIETAIDVRESGIMNPYAGHPNWSAADVDAIIYARIQRW